MKAKRLFLTATLVACTFAALAQDTIRMTWYEDRYYQYNKTFRLDATLGEQFMIDWGDGDTETIPAGVGMQFLNHTYGSTLSKQYTITITTIENCRFHRLWCDDMGLTNLELINCNVLDGISCENNKLCFLNFREGTMLQSLSCNKNCFPLSECYKMLKYTNYIDFRWQNLLPME